MYQLMYKLHNIKMHNYDIICCHMNTIDLFIEWTVPSSPFYIHWYIQTKYDN